MIGWKLGWKVLRNCPTLPMLHMTSAYAISGSVAYKYDAVVRPLLGCGPLAVFSSYRAAMEFRKGSEVAFSVHWCLYKPSRHDWVWIKDIGPYGWAVPLFLLPPGTALADEVMLIPTH